MSDLAFAGVTGQLAALAAKEVSSRELTQMCLDRIAKHDPVLNSFRTVYAESALLEADQADARRKAKEDRPLLGVPIAIKDDQDVRGDVTAYGSIAHGGPATADADIVRGLRERGAVIVGKTNVPELMTMAFTETLWYGVTRNPWDLDRTPGGSSGGSGAAVAAGLVPAATGSDGAGSIRIPAACNGLVGLKPTPGVVPTPESWGGLSTYGYIARTTADAALLYGIEPQEPGPLRVAWSVKPPPGALKGPDETMRGALHSLASSLTGLGHQVFHEDPDFGLAGVNIVARYLRGIHVDAEKLPHRERLDTRSRGLARMGALIPDSLHARATREQHTDRERICRSFENADLLLMPVFNTLPPRIGAYEGKGGVRSLNEGFTFTPFPGLFNHTGLPAIAVPCAQTEDGFPLAAMLVGPQHSEALLLGVSAQLEAELGWPARIPPGFAE